MEKQPIVTVAATLLLLLLFISSSDAIPEVSPALDTLQKQIGYTFSSPSLLVRAITHPSFSRENLRPLDNLGLDAARASASLRLLQSDPSIQPDDLSSRVSKATASSACSADAARLRLDRLIRVAPGTNASAASVVCAALRAIVGAVALDSGKIGTAGDVFARVHRDASGLRYDA